MSIFDKLLGSFRARQEAASYYRMLTTYVPHFKRWNGLLYEMDVVRSSIDAIARHVSKLNIKIDGAAQPKLQTMLKKRPNAVSTWSQFMYRTATILEMQNTAIIVPIFNRSMEIIGLWPVLPSRCKVLRDKNDRLWLEYKFSNDEVGAVELDRCGVLTKNQYENDLFGESNAALDDVMDMIEMQRQGIKEGIQASASFRFMARATNFKDPEDLAQEQRNFTLRNMTADKSGFLLFPNTYDGIQQIQSKPYTVSADDQKYIRQTVGDYFGVSEEILQNKATAAQLDAFFDGKVEPFAIQLEQVLTLMLFTDTEIGYGARVHITANRLQYMSVADKINFIAQLGDRGMITINEARELLNYTPIDGGDQLPIRGEYYFVGQDKAPNETAPAVEEGEDNGNQE